MEDLFYYFGNDCKTNVVFGFLPAPHVHFGDQIVCLNIIKSLNVPGFKINPLTSDAKELCSHFFDESVLTDLPITHLFNSTVDTLNKAYKNNFYKIKDDAFIYNKKYITYAFDCITNANHKPPYLEELINKLKQKYGNETVVSIGRHIEEPGSCLKNTLNYLLQSRVFIGMDSGMTQLCRCTTIPLVIIEHTNDIERTHPEHYCERFKGKSMNSILEHVDQLMK